MRILENLIMGNYRNCFLRLFVAYENQASAIRQELTLTDSLLNLPRTGRYPELLSQKAELENQFRAIQDDAKEVYTFADFKIPTEVNPQENLVLFYQQAEALSLLGLKEEALKEFDKITPQAIETLKDNIALRIPIDRN